MFGYKEPELRYDIIYDLYSNMDMSIEEMANELNCTIETVKYYLHVHNLRELTLSEQLYINNGKYKRKFL